MPTQDPDEQKTGGYATSIRLTNDGKQLLLALQKHLGLKRSGVIELAIRRLAAAEGLTQRRE